MCLQSHPCERQKDAGQEKVERQVERQQATTPGEGLITPCFPLPQEGAHSCYFQVISGVTPAARLASIPASVMSLLLECQCLKDSSHFLLLPLYND